MSVSPKILAFALTDKACEIYLIFHLLIGQNAHRFRWLGFLALFRFDCSRQSSWIINLAGWDSCYNFSSLCRFYLIWFTWIRSSLWSANRVEAGLGKFLRSDPSALIFKLSSFLSSVKLTLSRTERNSKSAVNVGVVTWSLWFYPAI